LIGHELEARGLVNGRREGGSILGPIPDVRRKRHGEGEECAGRGDSKTRNVVLKRTYWICNGLQLATLDEALTHKAHSSWFVRFIVTGDADFPRQGDEEK
jgi:hypothetical protein